MHQAVALHQSSSRCCFRLTIEMLAFYTIYGDDLESSFLFVENIGDRMPRS